MRPSLLRSAVSWLPCLSLRPRRGGPGSERGSILPYVSVACAVLATVALALMTGLGDVTLHRRDATTAADAAALAAAQAWADSIESMYDDAYGADDDDGLWGAAGSGIGSFAGAGVRGAASRYASRNGATLTSLSIDSTRRQVTVSVETDTPVEATGETMTASATAEVVLEEGACLSGGKVGFDIGGTCVTAQPNKTTTSTSTGGSSPTASAPPTSFTVPEGMADQATVSTKLVR
ncbi:pilus assembly protein TadG-related protein [Actinomyces wuliandei]|uniref:pilus assembly protein TadG-related protein n=1 Tax=Actinomyces wuliandei TaxID=2057743 RepID=UPI0015D64A0D|nr:pilus assembly protein TadG-related protein [Actinomyces wuliandei]